MAALYENLVGDIKKHKITTINHLLNFQTELTINAN